MKDFTVRKVEEIYSGRVVSVSVETFAFADGQEATREVVHHPGAVAIVPVVNSKEIILLKQFRYCAGRDLWEIPAGTIEPGETPLVCAHRELIEETGRRARKMEFLGGFYTSPGFTSEYLHLFAAMDLEPAEAHLDKDEKIEIHQVSFEEALQKIEMGEIMDAKTIVGLLRVSRRRMLDII